MVKCSSHVTLYHPFCLHDACTGPLTVWLLACEQANPRHRTRSCRAVRGWVLAGAGALGSLGLPGLPGYLVPAAVVLRGRAVVLQHFGDGALVDALQVQLPLPELQEAPAHRETTPTLAPLPPHEGTSPLCRQSTKASPSFTLAPRKRRDGSTRILNHIEGKKRVLGLHSECIISSPRPVLPC